MAGERVVPGIRVSASAWNAISHAGVNDDGFGFIVNGGDILQMDAQYRFLQNRGFDVGRRDVYPALRSKEAHQEAVKAIWEARCTGWWNLQHDLIDHYKLCTHEEYLEALAKA